MKKIKLSLTKKQTDLLRPVFDLLLCNIGMIVGQFFEAKEGPGFFEVAFINNERARALQKEMGGTVGRECPRENVVYDDVED